MKNNLMSDGQYMRIETIAVGVTTTNLNFIRACWTVLSENGKSRPCRDLRHLWMQCGLNKLNQRRGA